MTSLVIVKDWFKNHTNFDKWLIQYGGAFTNPNYRKRLTTVYWTKIIRSKTRKKITKKI